MKAKFIYENLDFERGKDPYDTLDIGRDKDKRKLISAAKQYADENIPIPYYPKESYFEEFADTTLSRIGPEFRLEWVLEDIGGWWEEWEEDKGLRVDEAQNFERGKDPKKAIGLGIPPEKIFNLGGAKKLPRGVEMSPARSAFGRYSDEEVKELLEDPVGYNNKTQGTIWLIGAGPGYRFFSVDYIIQKQKEFEYIEYDGKLYPINPVKESLDFERGEDPKKSMKIGIRGKVQEFMSFISKEMSWNDPNIIFLPEEDAFSYEGLPGNSLIADLREAVEKFGWKNIIKVNKDPDDWASRSYDDGASRHYYILSFKKNLKESLEFERGQDPKESMGVGRIRILKKIDDWVTPKEGRRYYNRVKDGDYKGNTIAIYKSIDAHPEHYIPVVLYSGGFNPNRAEIIDGAFHDTAELAWKDGVRMIDVEEQREKTGYYDEPIEESLDFERNINPKDSLKIGRKYSEVAHVKDIVDGYGNPINGLYDLKTFFGNIEMGLYPGNFYIVLDGKFYAFPSDELKKRGFKKLLFKDKMHVLG